MTQNIRSHDGSSGRDRIESFLRYWLPVLVWMCLIFTASTGAGSFHNSSRILGPFLDWLFPAMSQDDVSHIVFLIRKCAHMTEYAMLAFLLWRAIRKPVRNDPRPWSWRQALVVVLLVFLYAASDEFHQRFVPTRDPSIRDVIIDTCGGTLGMLALWVFWKIQRYASSNDN